MATLSDLSVIANDANFQNRVRYAMVVAAVNVYSENPNTVGHPARAALSTRVVNGQMNFQAVALAVLTNATIAAEASLATTPGFAIPDGDIQFAVNGLWNAFAGA
jgi:hypothetical protein